MKTKTTVIAAAFATALMMCACSHNNGDIGDYFGSWRMDSFTVGGREYPENLDRTMWNFQNNIICITFATDSLSSHEDHFGTWDEKPGPILSLDFGHHDDKTPPGVGVYSAPSWLLMTSKEVMEMRITDRSKGRMTLSWTDPEGNKIVYKLTKTW